MLRRLIPAFSATVIASTAGARPCQPQWADDLWGISPPGEVRTVYSHDAGAGPSLYFGTTSTAMTGAGAIAVWDRTRFKLLGSTSGVIAGSAPPGIYAVAVVDSGAGPQLHVAGNFFAIDGVTARGSARLTPAGWQPMGFGFSTGFPRALAVFDDGAGPALFAGGSFTFAGLTQANAVARWNGSQWTDTSGGLSGGDIQYIFDRFPEVFTLCVFDDGTGGGPALYAGGNFSQAAGAPAMAVARWRGVAAGGWEPVGNGLSWVGDEQGVVLSMTVFGGPAGPALYAVGRINFGPQNLNPIAARWDGYAWHPVASWIDTPFMSAIAAADYQGVPTLYTGVQPGYQSVSIFRMHNGTWTPAQSNSGTVNALCRFDDGAASDLAAAAPFHSLGTTHALWNSQQWSTPPIRGAAEPLTKVKVLDLGQGPALYAMGANRVGAHNGAPIARRTGAGWQPIGPALSVDTIYDAEVFNHGGAPMIHVASYRVHRATGTSWAIVGSSSALENKNVYALKAFDDGQGPRLYAAGEVSGAVRAWDGAAWTTPGGGLPAALGYGRDFELFDDGAGPRLYLALDQALRRWQSGTWADVPLPSALILRDLHVHDTGSGKALYAATADPYQPIIRYNGQAWTAIAAALEGGEARALATLNTGAGPQLVVTGRFHYINGVAANHIARWGGAAWSPLGSGLQSDTPVGGSTLAVTGTAGAQSLWIGGQFLSAGNQLAGHIARFGCEPPACYADCNNDGALGVADFGCFQTKFVAGDLYTDCNSDGARNVADFGCFQTRFAVGCP